MDGTGAATATRPMHIEESDAVPVFEHRAVEAAKGAPRGLEHAGRHMSRNDRVGYAAQPAVPQVNIGAAHFRALGAEQCRAGFQVGERKLAELNRLAGRRHDGRENAVTHNRTLPLNGSHFYLLGMRTLFRALLCLAVTALATPAAAQNYSVDKPRRQFITVSLDWMNTEPLHFASHPLEDLVGREVAAAQRETYEYRTRDEQIQIDVLQFRKRNRGASIAIYPLGLSTGMTVGIRGSLEDMPVIRIGFQGAGAPGEYALTGARAYDVGAGIYVADRSPGWGLGSQAFVVGGVGRIRGGSHDGTRMFAEGGGGLMVGPLGVQLAVKFAWNRFETPVEHRFLTIPVTLRGTLSF